MRIGGVNRLVHLITSWKPRNGKLLREAGYLAGYMRFGAVVAKVLARLCTGASLPDIAEIIALTGILVAEILEDIISFACLRAGIDLSPPTQVLTEQEILEKAMAMICSQKGRDLLDGGKCAVMPTFGGQTGQTSSAFVTI